MAILDDLGLVDMPVSGSAGRAKAQQQQLNRRAAEMLRALEQRRAAGSTSSNNVRDFFSGAGARQEQTDSRTNAIERAASGWGADQMGGPPAASPARQPFDLTEMQFTPNFDFGNFSSPKADANGVLSRAVSGKASGSVGSPATASGSVGSNGRVTLGGSSGKDATISNRGRDDDPDRPTTYNKGSGLGGILGEIGNFFIDAGRAGANFQSDALDFLGSKPAGTTRIGDKLFGSGPSQGDGDIAGPGRIDSRTRPRNSVPASPEEVEEAELTFADYLRMANDLSGGGVNYDPLRERARTNAAEGDARLNAMYSQLRQSFADDTDTIQGFYDDSAASMANSRETATGNIQSAYDAAAADQAATRAALGIEEAAGAEGRRGSLSGDLANQLSGVERVGDINQQQTLGNRASQLTYNTRLGQAAGAEGVSQQAALQRALADRLAEYDVSEQRDNMGMRDAMWGRAQHLAQWDRDAADRRAAKNAGPSLADLMLQEQIYGQQLKNQQSAAGLTRGDLGAQFAQAQQLAEAAGFDPSDSDAMKAILEMLQMTQKIYG